MHRIRTRTVLSSCLAAAAAWCWLAGTSAAQEASQPREPHQFLLTYIGLDQHQLAELERGRAISKLLETPLNREIAVFGVVWIEASIDFFLERYEDIETFESGSGVLKIHKLSDPPRAEDFAALTIPDEDFQALPDCRVGDCEVKASEENLERLHREVDWDAPDARQQANTIVRDMVLSYIEAYRRGGNAELAVYQDKKRPNFISREFQGLLQNSPYLPNYFPEFHAYLLNYPQAELPHSTDFFYWTENDIGLKPIVRLNHVTIYRPPGDPNRGAVIASKQLYCSHYFHTALELRYLARDSARPEADGFYFMNLNRSRSDGLTGFTGMMLGRTIRSRTRSGLQTYLEQTKAKIEKAYNARRKAD